MSGDTNSSNILKRKNPKAASVLKNPHSKGDYIGLLNQLLNSDAPSEDAE